MGKVKGKGKGKGQIAVFKRAVHAWGGGGGMYGAGARRRGGIGRLCVAMPIRIAMAWAHARPMAERL